MGEAAAERMEVAAMQEPLMEMPQHQQSQAKEGVQ